MITKVKSKKTHTHIFKDKNIKTGGGKGNSPGKWRSLKTKLGSKHKIHILNNAHKKYTLYNLDRMHSAVGAKRNHKRLGKRWAPFSKKERNLVYSPSTSQLHGVGEMLLRYEQKQNKLLRYENKQKKYSNKKKAKTKEKRNQAFHNMVPILRQIYATNSKYQDQTPTTSVPVNSKGVTTEQKETETETIGKSLSRNNIFRILHPKSDSVREQMEAMIANSKTKQSKLKSQTQTQTSLRKSYV